MITEKCKKYGRAANFLRKCCAPNLTNQIRSPITEGEYTPNNRKAIKKSNETLEKTQGSIIQARESVDTRGTRR